MHVSLRMSLRDFVNVLIRRPITDARFHGLTPFCVYQGKWSAADRDFERDILPMCEAEGMGLAPWGVLGRGAFRSAEDYAATDREGRKMGQSENHRLIGEKLAQLAKQKKTQITSVALAYILLKAPYVFPIIGGRKVEHLLDNIDALGVELTTEEIYEIEDAAPFDVGFPMDLLFEFGGQKFRTGMGAESIRHVTHTTRLDTVPRPVVSSHLIVAGVRVLISASSRSGRSKVKVILSCRARSESKDANVDLNNLGYKSKRRRNRAPMRTLS